MHRRGNQGRLAARAEQLPWVAARHNRYNPQHFVEVPLPTNRRSPMRMKTAVLAARFPWTLVAAALGLAVLGLYGISRSEDLAEGGGNFLRRQVVWCVVALVAMWLATLPSYRLLCRWSYAAFALAMVLLVAVYFFPPAHGAQRWIRLGGVGLQPSEFAKVTFVLAMSRYLMYRENYRRFRGLVAPLLLALVPLVLILREPDLGTSLVFLPLVYAMLYAAGARGGDLVKVGLCGAALLPLLWTQMSGEQRSRVTALVEQTRPGEKPTDDGYHLHQAKQVLSLGGMWGSFIVGEQASDRSVYHLPEDHTDFIFTVLGERFGWLGTGGVLLLFALFVWRGMAVAEATREPFGRLAAMGLTALFGIQALVNTAMTVGLLPITGMSLPLVSYGGSGLLAHAIALGLIVNIALRPGYDVAGEPFRYAVASAR
jgi:rod shape determining protein RodA